MSNAWWHKSSQHVWVTCQVSLHKALSDWCLTKGHLKTFCVRGISSAWYRPNPICHLIWSQAFTCHDVFIHWWSLQCVFAINFRNGCAINTMQSEYNQQPTYLVIMLWMSSLWFTTLEYISMKTSMVKLATAMQSLPSSWKQSRNAGHIMQKLFKKETSYTTNCISVLCSSYRLDIR